MRNKNRKIICPQIIWRETKRKLAIEIKRVFSRPEVTFKHYFHIEFIICVHCVKWSKVMDTIMKIMSLKRWHQSIVGPCPLMRSESDRDHSIFSHVIVRTPIMCAWKSPENINEEKGDPNAVTLNSWEFPAIF